MFSIKIHNTLHCGSSVIHNINIAYAISLNKKNKIIDNAHNTHYNINK